MRRKVEMKNDQEFVIVAAWRESTTVYKHLHAMHEYLGIEYPRPDLLY